MVRITVLDPNESGKTFHHVADISHDTNIPPQIRFGGIIA